MYLYLYRGNGTPSNTVTIRYNLATNADGRQSDGAGGLIPGNVSHSLTNFVQFNQLQGLPGADISWNQSTDEAYKSLSEDKVNMYVSSGTAASPIRIHDNLIQGAYNADPANDPSFSGGGIILGDGPVTAPEQSAHIWAYGNTVLDTTNYGMAIAGGSDMRIYNNRILSTGVLPDGRHVLAQNVGLYVWDYGNAGSLMQGNVASDNVLFWRKWDQGGTPVNNAWWLPDCTAARASTCTGNTVPTSADMSAEVQAWQTRVAAAGYSIGAPR